MLEIAHLRQALLQSLENYQRCGLERIPRAMAETLPSEMLAAIEQSRQAASLPKTQQAEQYRPQPIEVAVPAVPQTTMPAESIASAQTQSEADIVADRQWSLPTLSLEERKERFELLDGEIKACRKCSDIVCYRQQTVFGTGPLQPTVCFMGEAPGADEDRTGKPFVGSAGQLLTKIIEAMQLKRDEVFILNALKCRPPQNRTPVPDEIEHCHPYVATQLEILQPKYIVCLGAVAVRSLLGLTLPVGSLRGRFHQYRQARVVVTYHPSYLLRNESAKRLVWQDMQMLMREMGLKLPGQNSK